MLVPFSAPMKYLNPVLSLLALTSFASAAPIEIGSRREMFVDDALIDHLSGRAELRLNEPVQREVVLRHDEPWEGSGR